MITVLIPHFKQGKVTAYSISQWLRYSDDRVKIVLIDNSYPHDSIKYLEPFKDKITIVNNISDKIGSHGIAYDDILPTIDSEYFLTSESDSFPVKPFIHYYQKLIDEGYDAAGSLMQLSGGQYIHGAGALYRTSCWHEALEYTKSIPYRYFPNMGMKGGFACHVMLHNEIMDEVLSNPGDWLTLSDGYKGLTKKEMLDKAEWYSPTTKVMHNGMGGLEEDISTYGKRNIEQDSAAIMYNDKWRKIIFRIGYEPSQFMAYYLAANSKKIKYLDTEIVWMKGRENQQQKYTETISGIRHLWAGSSFLDMKGTEMNDVYEYKFNAIENLYNSLVINQKIFL